MAGGITNGASGAVGCQWVSLAGLGGWRTAAYGQPLPTTTATIIMVLWWGTMYYSLDGLFTLWTLAKADIRHHGVPSCGPSCGLAGSAQRHPALHFCTTSNSVKLDEE